MAGASLPDAQLFWLLLPREIGVMSMEQAVQPTPIPRRTDGGRNGVEQGRYRELPRRFDSRRHSGVTRMSVGLTVPVCRHCVRITQPISGVKKRSKDRRGRGLRWQTLHATQALSQLSYGPGGWWLAGSKTRNPAKVATNTIPTRHFIAWRPIRKARGRGRGFSHASARVAGGRVMK